MKEFEITEIIGFIEERRKTIKPTATDWGFDCLHINDVLELLEILGVKIILEKKEKKS